MPTPGNWVTSQETPTLYRTVDAAGVRRLVMFSGRYPVRMAVSLDDGFTWTPLKPIGDFGGTVAMADMVLLKDGSYMALFHGLTRRSKPLDLKCPCGRQATRVCGVMCWDSDECYYCDTCTPAPNHGADAIMPIAWTPRIAPDVKGEGGIYKTISTDGGLTWCEPQLAVASPFDDAYICEPGAIRSPDGSEIALLLRENHRRYNSFITFSKDEGMTWTTPREVASALTGDRHQGIYAPDDRLFISFRDMTHNSPTRGDWVGWVGTWEDLRDNREGQYRVRIMDNHPNPTGPERNWDCAYPGVVCLTDGTIVTTTYGHWSPGLPPYIVSVRFALDELDGMRPQ